MKALYDFGQWIEWNEYRVMDTHLTESEIHDMYMADLATDMAEQQTDLGS